MTIEPWILTHSGRKFWPLDPNPDDVCIEDIAHALARTCRFGGHCEPSYSVAQHSVLVSHICRKRDALWGLMHDAAEALSGFGDVAKPVKDNIMLVISATDEMLSVGELETRILRVIATALDIPWPPPDLKGPDQVALMLERNSMMPEHPDWPKQSGFSPSMIPADSRVRDTTLRGRQATVASGGFIYHWGPILAESRFLERYHELRETT